jgi:Xaa-Pro dipeptidase
MIKTPFKDARKAAYFNAEGADRPLISPVAASTVAAARAYRLGRLRAALAGADVAGLLMYDPINIRYAFDSSNMQVWTAHNPIRYALLRAFSMSSRAASTSTRALSASTRSAPRSAICS